MTADSPAEPSTRAVRRSLPPAGRLRREHEQRPRDLGGLVLEMFRHDRFRQDPLLGRYDELAPLDDRVAELDTLLDAAVTRGRVRPPVRCECAAPVFRGARFCGRCGRPVSE